MAVRCKFFDECKGYAISIVPFSKMPLCKYHFLKYIKDRVWKTINNYDLIDFNDENEKILVALSGGKDSQTLLHILNRALEKKVKMEALYIDIGIKPRNYSKKSLEVAEKITADFSVPLNVIDVKEETGFNIDDVHKLSDYGKYKSKNRYRGECSYCGVIKRYLINKYAYENGFTKVATGHNLTDEATTLFSNFLNIDLDLMSRAGPITITEIDKLVPRIKPLYFIYESELILYTFYADIPHVSTRCMYARDSPMLKIKRSLKKIEDFRRATMRNMVYEFQQKMRNIIFENRAEEKTIENYCEVCKMPTYVYSDRCSYCKIISRLNQDLKKYEIIK